MKPWYWLGAIAIAIAALSCSNDEGPVEEAPDLEAPDTLGASKADEFSASRRFEVYHTDPHCDVCTNADKDHLLANSDMMDRIIELIDGAQRSVEVAQFTFSRRQIEEAILNAHNRGVDVRVAMNSAQSQGDNPSTRLRDAGVNISFVKGKDVNGQFNGLQHAKFVIVDDDTIAMGSNNYSSTGFSVNDENTLVFTSSNSDPIVEAFNCYFDMMFENNLVDAATCSSPDARFTPSTHPWKMLRDEMRTAKTSVDVLMHHLVFKDAVKELAKAAERGVRVRVIVNAEDRDETQGRDWDRLRAANGLIRYKKTNPELFQFMHNKLAIIDGVRLLNGSGNWSGSAFFNNWEWYVRLQDSGVLDSYNAVFTKLWNWSLTADSLDAGLDARGQDFASRKAYFGNLHAHFDLEENGKLLDDGKLEREVAGELVDVTAEAAGDPIRHAFEYARDKGQLDFIALSPHVVDDRPEDPADIASITVDAYGRLVATASAVTDESAGRFVALPSFEWSTNSTGNHVNVLGTTQLCKVERGDFATFWEGYLPVQREAGNLGYVMLNHPRTFRTFDSLNGSWDQIFGVNLQEIPNNSDRAQKFNDFGLDDFSPLREVLPSWIDGTAMPDEAVVKQTQRNIAEVSAPYHRLMEVTVSRGNEFASEEPQNPSLSLNQDTMEIERFTKVHSNWDYYLANGWKLAPVASHDNHKANWGTGHTSRTGIIAEDLTQAALLSAIGERAVFATEDPNFEVHLYGENRVRAGQDLTTIAPAVALQFFAADPDVAGTVRVRIWGGTVGGTIEMRQELDLPIGNWQTLEVDTGEIGSHVFYVEVHQTAADRMAWSAPIFIERE